MVIRLGNASTDFEYPWNLSRKSCWNLKLNLKRVRDCQSARELGVHPEAAVKDEVRSPWDDTQPRLPRQKIVEPPASVCVKTAYGCDGPKVAVSMPVL